MLVRAALRKSAKPVFAGIRALFRKFLTGINRFDALLAHLLHRTIDRVVDGPYTTSQLDVVPGSKER